MSALGFSLGTRVPGHAAPKEALFYARETHVAARCGIQWASHLAQEEKKTLRGDSRSVTKIADSVTASSLRAPALECLTKFPCNKPGERRQDSSEKRKRERPEENTHNQTNISHPPRRFSEMRPAMRPGERTTNHTPRVLTARSGDTGPAARALSRSLCSRSLIYSSQILHPLHNRL